MALNMQNPALQGGASRDLLGGWSHPPITMFADHRKAALALLHDRPTLSHKEAGFLGHVCVAPILSDKQRDWLVKLLARYDMAALTSGGVR
jgi:hypothetical protein